MLLPETLLGYLKIIILAIAVEWPYFYLSLQRVVVLVTNDFAIIFSVEIDVCFLVPISLLPKKNLSSLSYEFPLSSNIFQCYPAFRLQII
jgi:hypothetical protein